MSQVDPLVRRRVSDSERRPSRRALARASCRQLAYPLRERPSVERHWLGDVGTESLERPVAFAVSKTLPGASAQCRLLVSGMHTTVAILLRLNESLWTTTTGHLNPGSEPRGSPRSAHQTSPWEITTRSVQACDAPLPKELVRADLRAHHVESLRHLVRRVPGDVFAHGSGVDLAAGLLGTASERLSLFEHVIWNRDRCLHTGSITASRAQANRRGDANATSRARDGAAVRRTLLRISRER